MTNKTPLNGFTIVELGHSVAAPYAGVILADLGARVIKVENPASGDYARDWPPFTAGGSTAFAALNRGKDSVTVDFTNAGEVASLHALILMEADAVIQNLRPGLLDRFGLSGEAMRAEKPSLVWCDIGAFGATGPLALKPGYDPLVQASAGIMSVTGEAARPPVRVGVSLVDMGAGMWTVIGLLATLLGRAQTGQGGAVSTSLYETGLAWMTVPLASYSGSGEVRLPSLWLRCSGDGALPGVRGRRWMADDCRRQRWTVPQVLRGVEPAGASDSYGLYDQCRASAQPRAAAADHRRRRAPTGSGLAGHCT